jgi:hypothetical protein
MTDIRDGEAIAARRRRFRLLGAVAIAILVVGAAGALVWQRWGDSGTRLGEPSCGPLSTSATAGCVATFPIHGIDVWPSTTIALSPQTGTLLVTGTIGTNETQQALVGLAIADGHEIWRLPITGAKPSVAVSAAGDKVALWSKAANSPVRILGVPDGHPIAEIAGEGLNADAAFVADGTAIVLGARNTRRIQRFSGGSVISEPAPGFIPGGCGGAVGQGSSDRVVSRDNTVLVQVNTTGDSLSFRAGRIESAEGLKHTVLCDTPGFTILPAPAGWPGAAASFLSFSPDDDRLAIVYAVPPLQDRDGGTIVEIRDMSGRHQIGDADTSAQPAEILASFVIDGTVHARLGWSPDGHRLAVLEDPTPGQDRQEQQARIYAVP